MSSEPRMLIADPTCRTMLWGNSASDTTLHVVIRDGQRSGSIPTGERLRVGADHFEIRQIGIRDRYIRRIHRHAPPRAQLRIAVQVTAVEYEITGKLRQRSLAALPEPNQLQQIRTCGW